MRIEAAEVVHSELRWWDLCASARADRVDFQACYLNHSDISPQVPRRAFCARGAVSSGTKSLPEGREPLNRFSQLGDHFVPLHSRARLLPMRYRGLRREARTNSDRSRPNRWGASNCTAWPTPSYTRSFAPGTVAAV